MPRWNAKNIEELSNNLRILSYIEIKSKNWLTWKKMPKKKMKEYYIKLNWIYAWGGAEGFSICQRLNIKRDSY